MPIPSDEYTPYYPPHVKGTDPFYALLTMIGSHMCGFLPPRAFLPGRRVLATPHGFRIVTD